MSASHCSCSCAHTSIFKTFVSHNGTDTALRVWPLEGIDVAVCIWLHFCNLYAPLVSFSVSPFDCEVRHEDGKYKCGSARQLSNAIVSVKEQFRNFVESFAVNLPMRLFSRDNIYICRKFDREF